jgi:DNA-binding NarL/FixJ family response regulator
MKKTRILLADDHAMICAGFQKLLEPEYEVVGTVGDGHALLKTAEELKPDLVLVDIGMPLLNGLDAARQLKKLMPKLKVIFLTMNPDSDVASEALRIGASGYLVKNSHGEELLKAVRDVVRGMSYVTPQIRKAMEQRFIEDPKAASRPKHLTPRHREILQMLAEGRAPKEIASILDISVRTVRFHKYEIMKELGIATNAELVQYAIKHSLIPPRRFPTSDRGSLPVKLSIVTVFRPSPVR